MSLRPASGLPRQAQRRGRPVIMLALVLGGWSLLRAATWEGPQGLEQVVLPQVAEAAGSIAAPLAMPVVNPPQRQPGQPLSAPQSPVDQLRITPSGPNLLPAPLPPLGPSAQRPVPPSSQRMAVGQAMLMAAGFGAMQLPPDLAAWFNARTPGAPARSPQAGAQVPQSNALAAAHNAAPLAAAPAEAPRRASRWTADGWLLWRDDATTPINSGRPTYGRSQAGAVARYRLAPASRHAPQAYLRVATALQGTREREAALGLSARPLAQVPVRVAAELRASERPTGTELRPAAYAVTELAPQALPLGASAEAYAQAGYVGGSARTAFVDGQVRVDRSVARHDDFDLRAGGGAWGGAQRGTARLDVGPSASVTFDLGEARGRLAADYRFRVAGDARPASGPALTLSAGF